jgi:transposase
MEEVRELRAQLRKDSSNSSKPPSSDAPWKPPEQRAPKGKRKRGGQPGHGKHERAMVTPNHVVQVLPSVCRGCGEGLRGEDPEPLRHQVVEVPQVVAEVTEYRLHTLSCGCGVRTPAVLPEGVPHRVFGPRLQAMIVVCSGAYRLSKRNIGSLMRDFFGVSISLGSISNLEAATSRLLQPAFEEAHQRVQESMVAHADETPWFEGRQAAWIWVAVTATAVVFLIRAKRTAAVAKELIGKHFRGVLITDQLNSYDWQSASRRQLCWAHLVRHFRSLLDPEESGTDTLGHRLLALTEVLFSTWHRARDRTINRAQLRRQVEPLQQQFHALLCEGVKSSNRRARVMCTGLLRDEVSLWTFIRRKTIAPTNNAAERALRHGVIWRKTSFGTDSERGSRFVERMLTVVATLRLQDRNVLEFVTQTCTASLQGRPAPALLQA